MESVDFSKMGMICGLHMYSNLDTKETIVETWGASTKHPDMYRVVEKHPYLDCPLADLAQALMQMGADMLFPFHAMKYAQVALDILKLEFN